MNNTENISEISLLILFFFKKELEVKGQLYIKNFFKKKLCSPS